MKEGSGLIRHTPPFVTSQLAISDAILSGGDSAVKPSVCQVAGTRLGQPPQRAATRACAPRTPRAAQCQGRRRTMTHIGRHCGGQSIDMRGCARPRRLATFSTQSRVQSARSHAISITILSHVRRARIRTLPPSFCADFISVFR